VHCIRSTATSDPVIASVPVLNKVIQFEIDTGSGVSVINEKQFKSLFQDSEVLESNVLLNSVSGPVPVTGEVIVSVSVLGQTHSLRLILCTDTTLNLPLLGREWLDTLNPQWRQSLFPFGSDRKNVSHLASPAIPSVEELGKQFPAIFQTNSDSCIRNFTASLVLKADARPIKHGPYSIAFGALKPVEAILNDWEQSGKAIRVRHADWASPAVPVLKKDGTIRLCVDFKTTLNPNLRVDYYPLPRPDTIFAHLCNGVFFTSLDLKDAYTQLKLDKDSQELCVVNTHKGYYKLTRLIYGVASSAAIFQSVMDDILADLEGTVCYIDNILIQGRTIAECLSRTLLVLGRLDKYNVRLNPNKCQFFTKELEFLGFVISKGSRGQAPSLTNAIVNAKIPENVKEVNSFLGLLNFYSEFVPMISTLEKPLRLLTRSDVQFDWNESCQTAFDQCKSIIVSADVLMLFGPSRSIT